MKYVVVLLALLAGCALQSSDTVAKAWTGKHLREAMAKLGPPTYTTPLPGGDVLYVWQENFGNNNQAVCRKGLQVNAQGVIVGASQQNGSLLCS